MILELCGKMYEKVAKICHHEKCYNMELIEIVGSKVDTKILKSAVKFCQSLKLVSS